MSDGDPVDVISGKAGSELTEDDLLTSLDPALAEWWRRTFGRTAGSTESVFTPPQLETIPQVLAGHNVLVTAPTGTGKTLASFTAILDTLLRKDRAGTLEDTVYCLYVSPLRALANDIHRNLDIPLEGIYDIRERNGEDAGVIRHAIRHGDTDDTARQEMLERPPHILNTTPETLAILLNAPKFREKLRTVEYIIVDEIHSLAADKRGSHLSVSLERLATLTNETPTRIGCSATVEPLDVIADFLVGRRADGTTRARKIVDQRHIREYDIELRSPVADLIGTPHEAIRGAMYEELHELIQSHATTIVFTNTRSGAERVLHQLRERYPAYTRETSGCHHGSLSKEERTRIEQGLKDGSFRVVTTSTSLELGIDMPDVDLVIQLGSPKSVTALLQRFGRSGHRIGETVTGRVFALDRDDLRECAVMVDRASAGVIDRVFPPDCPLDVAIQHIYGMAIAEVRPEDEVRAILERSYPFRELTDTTWERVLAYLTGDYPGLEDRNVYPKIWRDANDPPGGRHHYADFDVGERLIGKRGRLARVIYFTNIGTIPDTFSCHVLTRSDQQWVGSLDETYLDTLAPGDVFLLGGEGFVFRYRRGGRVYVDRTSDRPTVPSWYSERLPLAYDLGREILRWQREVIAQYERGGESGVRAHLAQMPMDTRAVTALTRMVLEQLQYAGIASMSTPEHVAIEEVHDHEAYVRRYYVHTPYGRAFNDGLSRLLAAKCTRASDGDVPVAVSDAGFSLTMPLNRKIDLPGVITDIRPGEVRDTLREALRGTELLKRYFRMNATRSLMILTRYKGYEKTAKEQQFSSEFLLGYAEDLEDFAVLEETYRELLEDKLSVAHIEAWVRAHQNGSLSIRHERIPSPSPFSFGLATLSSSDSVITTEESRQKHLQQRVHESLERDSSTDGAATVATDRDLPLRSP